MKLKKIEKNQLIRCSGAQSGELREQQDIR